MNEKKSARHWSYKLGWLAQILTVFLFPGMVGSHESAAGASGKEFKSLPLSGIALNPKQADVVLVQNGIPQATIVTAVKPTFSTQLAVAEFNYHIKRITGTALVVTNAAADNIEGNLVLIGKSKMTLRYSKGLKTLENEEYLITTRPGLLLMVGKDKQNFSNINYKAGSKMWEKLWSQKKDWHQSRGTLYAVYDFLEQSCGVRWFLPGNNMTVIKKQDTLAFSSIKYRRRPWTRLRKISPIGFFPKKLYFWKVNEAEAVKQLKNDPSLRLPLKDSVLYWLRLRVGGDNTFSANHSFGYWRKRFAKSHPEYFSVKQNNNYNFNHINLTSDAVVKQTISDIKNWLAGKKFDAAGIPLCLNVKNNSFPVVPQDGRVGSNDEKSIKIMGNDFRQILGWRHSATRSEYVFQFVNRIAHEIKKIFPEVVLRTLAYHEYFFPPKNMFFESNISLQICKQQVKARSSQFDQEIYAALREWRNKIKQPIYIWEYFNFPQYYFYREPRGIAVFPGIVPRRIGKEMQELSGLIDGYDIHIGSRGKLFPGWRINPALQHLNYYFALKLLSDSRFTIDDLLQDYYFNFYGPAASAMSQFFRRIEDIYLDRTNAKKVGNSDPFINIKDAWTIYCPLQKLPYFELPLIKAESLANIEPYKSRVKLIREAVYEFISFNCKLYYKQNKLYKTGKEMVINGGFEAETDNWEIGKNIKYTFVPGHTGKTALRIENVKTVAMSPKQHLGNKLKNNKSYSASFAFKTAGPATFSSTLVVWSDAKKSYYAKSIINRYIDESSTWIEVNKIIHIKWSGNATKAFIRFCSKGYDGNFVPYTIDNVSLKEIKGEKE